MDESFERTARAVVSTWAMSRAQAKEEVLRSVYREGGEPFGPPNRVNAAPIADWFEQYGRNYHLAERLAEVEAMYSAERFNEWVRFLMTHPTKEDEDDG